MELDSTAFHAAQVWHSLGNLLTKNSARWSDAEEAYERGWALHPLVVDKAHVDASLASHLSKYHEAEADDRAEQLALRSLEIDRDNPWTNGISYRVLADVYERRGDNQSAINALESLMETNRRLGERKFEQSIRSRIANLRRSGRRDTGSDRSGDGAAGA